jgi:hypothetical protein
MIARDAPAGWSESLRDYKIPFCLFSIPFLVSLHVYEVMDQAKM